MKVQHDKNLTDGSILDESKDPFYGLLFTVGVAENKNITYRATMEDVHTYVANFAEQLDWGYFAIFDGHAGKKSARWCGNNLHTLLEKEILDEKLAVKDVDLRECLCNAFTKADEAILKENAGNSGCTAAVAVLRWVGEDGNDVEQQIDAIKHNSESSSGSGNEENDELSSGAEKDTKDTKDTKDDEEKKNDKSNVTNESQKVTSSNNVSSPSTLSSSSSSTSASEQKANTQTQPPINGKKYDFIPTSKHKRMLYTLNVGDLRILLLRLGKPYRLLYDHKATDINEINRIHNTGGLIIKNRVNGVLAVTRSLGDSYMKDLVIGHPYTTATELSEEDEFMILACDGLWDVVLDTQAVQVVHEALQNQKTVSQAAKKLCQLAMDLLTTDNVTIMIVRFDRGVFELGEAVGKMTV